MSRQRHCKLQTSRNRTSNRSRGASRRFMHDMVGRSSPTRIAGPPRCASHHPLSLPRLQRKMSPDQSIPTCSSGNSRSGKRQEQDANDLYMCIQQATTFTQLNERCMTLACRWHGVQQPAAMSKGQQNRNTAREFRQSWATKRRYACMSEYKSPSAGVTAQHTAIAEHDRAQPAEHRQYIVLHVAAKPDIHCVGPAAASLSCSSITIREHPREVESI